MTIKVLIADDETLNQVLLTKIAKQQGFHAEIAENGQDAIEKFEKHRHDLVLMDVMMPVMDGLEATATIKRIADHWVPIIILSALSDHDQIMAGLKAGAEDYLGKPLQIDILKVKLRHFENAIRTQRLLEEQNRELRRYQFVAEDEKRVATHLMHALVDVDRMARPGIEWWLDAADSFNGDVLASASTPAGAYHFMLADGTGHGLAAALSVQPLPDIFYTMTLRGYSIASIALEINRRVGLMLPIDRFFATTLVAITPRERMIEVWNGGNPPALLVGGDGQVIHAFESKHLPLGILRNDLFGMETERLVCPQGAHLLLMSDGLLDVYPARSIENLQMLMQETQVSEWLERIKADALMHLEGHDKRDDISLFLIDIGLLSGDLSSDPVIPTHPVDQEQGAAWKFQLRLNGNQLRSNQEVVPMVMGMAEQLVTNQKHRVTLFLVLSELFNNSLDHGLLELDSGIKHGQGFDAYLELRARRLSRLNGCAYIEMNVEMKDASVVFVTVLDSGGGFDYDEILAKPPAPDACYGRGIALVSSLAQSIDYLGKGNEVRVVLNLGTEGRIQNA